jgi:hypothetical protein
MIGKSHQLEQTRLEPTRLGHQAAFVRRILRADEHTPSEIILDLAATDNLAHREEGRISVLLCVLRRVTCRHRLRHHSFQAASRRGVSPISTR